MQEAFAIVLFVVVAVSAVAAVVALAHTGRAYDDIGAGGLDAPRSSPPWPAGDAGLEAEIRALVEAGNRRRLARGEAPLDVDAEVTRRLREG